MKFKEPGADRPPCLGCADRTVEPNCHMTCGRYRDYRAVRDAIQEAKRQEHSVDEANANGFIHRYTTRDWNHRFMRGAHGKNGVKK